MAFDLYDIASDRFVSQVRLHTALHGSSIPVCPFLQLRRFESSSSFHSDLLDLLETKSRFRPDGGLVEGIVVRIECDGWLTSPCKLTT